MKEKAKGGVFDKLPPTLIRKDNVTLIPEGAIGYLFGPTLALLANSVLSNYFNKYMSDVLHVNTWASAFFTWLPVISVIFVVIGNVLVGRLMDNIHSRNGKARPLLLVSVPVSLAALLFLFIFSPFSCYRIQPVVCLRLPHVLYAACVTGKPVHTKQQGQEPSRHVLQRRYAGSHGSVLYDTPFFPEAVICL